MAFRLRNKIRMARPRIFSQAPKQITNQVESGGIEISRQFYLDNQQEIDTYLREMLDSTDENEYDVAGLKIVVLLSKQNVEIPFSDLRLLFCQPDGTVVYDSGKTNSRELWKSKSINENHNTRVAIMQAQLLEEGIGEEIRQSTSVEGNFSHYYAVRLGSYKNNDGTIIISVQGPNLKFRRPRPTQKL